jgi:hypothetical protein
MMETISSFVQVEEYAEKVKDKIKDESLKKEMTLIIDMLGTVIDSLDVSAIDYAFVSYKFMAKKHSILFFNRVKKLTALIKEVVKEKNIHTLWFEAHYMYRKKLALFAEQFAPVQVKFRCGVETFDAGLRDAWKKGIPSSVTPEDVAKYFQGVCLLCCTQGESKDHIMKDIEIAQTHFEYFSVNVFCNNSTSVKQDKELAQWFAKEVYPRIKDEEGIEVLMENTDLGVG